MNKQIRGYGKKFFKRATMSAVRILARDGGEFEMLGMDAPKNGYRICRLYVKRLKAPYATWREKC